MMTIINRNKILIILLILLILSNSIWFYRFHIITSKYLEEIGDCKANLHSVTSTLDSCNKTIDKINLDCKQKIEILNSQYKRQLENCQNTCNKVKEIIKYKTVKVPVEKIKVVKELEPCNIQIIEVKENEDPIKSILDHIGY